MAVIEITNISEETLARLMAKARERKANSVEEYARALLEQDVQADTHTSSSSAVRTLEEILAPIHAQVEASGISDGELDQLFEQAREEVRKARLTNPEAHAAIKEHPLAKVIGSMDGETWREIMEEMERERLEEDRRAAHEDDTEQAHVSS